MNCLLFPSVAIRGEQDTPDNERLEVFTAVTKQNGVFWDVSRVALVGASTAHTTTTSGQVGRS
jgi:hypothetical protein